MGMFLFRKYHSNLDLILDHQNTYLYQKPTCKEGKRHQTFQKHMYMYKNRREKIGVLTIYKYLQKGEGEIPHCTIHFILQGYK